MEEKELYTLAEASKILRISRDRLYEYLRNEYIQGVRITNKSAWRIPRSELERLMGKGKRIKAREANEGGFTKATGRILGARREEQFLRLLQRWREQAQFISVAELLRKFRFENWGTERTCELTEPEEVSRLYLEVYGQHIETIPRPFKALLPVEAESLFAQLKKLYPDAVVWRAQESWDKAYGIYLEAFISWVMEVVYNAELLMGLAASENISSDLDNRVANARQLVKMAKRAKPDVWLFLRLLAVVVGCDLLVLGIQEQPPSATWCGEVTEILKLRDDVVLTSKKELPEDFWLDGENKVDAIAKPLWDKDKLVKEKTTALLRALNELRKVQDNVRDKLRALELSLSGDSSILTSGKT